MGNGISNKGYLDAIPINPCQNLNIYLSLFIEENKKNTGLKTGISFYDNGDYNPI
jgi:hypothetical protein